MTATDRQRYERACLDYLRLVFGRFMHITELARMRALARAARAIMTAPGGTA